MTINVASWSHVTVTKVERIGRPMGGPLYQVTAERPGGLKISFMALAEECPSVGMELNVSVRDPQWPQSDS